MVGIDRSAASTELAQVAFGAACDPFHSPMAHKMPSPTDQAIEKAALDLAGLRNDHFAEIWRVHIEEEVKHRDRMTASTTLELVICIRRWRIYCRVYLEKTSVPTPGRKCASCKACPRLCASASGRSPTCPPLAPQARARSRPGLFSEQVSPDKMRCRELSHVRACTQRIFLGETRARQEAVCHDVCGRCARPDPGLLCANAGNSICSLSWSDGGTRRSG